MIFALVRRFCCSQAL